MDDASKKIINLIFRHYDDYLTMRSISKNINVPLSVVSKKIAVLLEEGVVSYKEIGRSKILMLNLMNSTTYFTLLEAEAYESQVFLSSHSQFKLFFNELYGMKTGFELVLLFGSFASGLNKIDSDIDVLTVGSFDQPLPQYVLSNKLHHIRMDDKTFNKNINEKSDFIKEILKNHVVLLGHSFFIGEMISMYGK